MLQLEEILEMWKKDAIIDEMNLDDASIETTRLHAKYLEVMTFYKLSLKKREADFKVLLKKKWLWYNGKMSKDEMDELGWSYDALNGLKILKGEMDYYYNSDPDIQKAEAKIDYIKTILETLREIMDNIRWRHQTIKNTIEWRKFTSGV